MGLFSLFAQTEQAVPVTTLYDTTTVTTADAGSLIIFSGVYLLFWLIILVLLIVALWKVFTKAGEAGWKAIIPVLNILVLLKIIGRPWWWLLLFFVPIVQLVVSVVVALDLGKAFSKDAVFSVVLLWLFSPIGYLIIGFGDAKYVAPSGGPAPSAPATTA